jgi:hypothetical protein
MCNPFSLNVLVDRLGLEPKDLKARVRKEKREGLYSQVTSSGPKVTSQLRAFR